MDDPGSVAAGCSRVAYRDKILYAELQAGLHIEHLGWGLPHASHLQDIDDITFGIEARQIIGNS
jgi:hypothetical protein